MPALRRNRGPKKADADPLQKMTLPYGLVASRPVCPHWVGSQGQGDATCTRNDPPVSVHEAFQRVTCRTDRHERCPVFLGREERLQELDAATGEARRRRLLKQIALPGALGLALVIGVVGLVAIGGFGTTPATPASTPAEAVQEAPPSEPALATFTQAAPDGADAGRAGPASSSLAPPLMDPEGSEAAAGQANLDGVEVTSIEFVAPPAGESPEDGSAEAEAAEVVIEDGQDEARAALPPDLQPVSATQRVTTPSGRGVLHRSDCVLSARLPSGWLNGQIVELLGVGVGRCVGWSYAASAGYRAWIQTVWLVPVS